MSATLTTIPSTKPAPKPIEPTLIFQQWLSNRLSNLPSILKKQAI